MKKIIVIGLLFGSISLYSEEKVYIVPNGKVYHSTEKCRTLSRSKNIKAIDIKDVGNRKPCKVC